MTIHGLVTEASSLWAWSCVNIFVDGGSGFGRDSKSWENPLKPSIIGRNSQFLHLCSGDEASRQATRPILRSPGGMDIRSILLLLFLTAALASAPEAARSQSLGSSGGSTGFVTGATSLRPEPAYISPTQRTMRFNYAFDAFGPYPIAGSAVVAGIGQYSNAPPEWNQGLKGYSRRFGSDFGIAAVGTTSRYALAEVFKEDTLYYRCECRGVIPRLRHAVLSTLTARHGEDGHRVFSFPALVAPYVGSMTAVYGWYPDRFGAKDGLRIGSYNMLAYVGSNISLEFFYSKPHSLLSRMHLNNAHGAPDPGPNH